MSHKILVAQGGGPTAVINQSLVGVALEARRFSSISHVYGALHGVRGIVNDDLVDLGQETVANLEAVAATPASALGSTRDKPDLKYCQEIFKVLKAHEIDTFFYIGGNEFLRHGAHRGRGGQEGRSCAQRHPYPEDDRQRPRRLRPCPRLPIGGALRRAGVRRRQPRQRGAARRLLRRRDGTPAGFLTAASALARKYPGDEPHMSYVPERPAGSRISRRCEGRQRRHWPCMVAVSEGMHDEKGETIVAKLAARRQGDAHGNVRLSGSGELAELLCEQIKKKLGVERVRGDTFGYLQRSFVGCGADVDQREAREVSEKAVRCAVGGALRPGRLDFAAGFSRCGVDCAADPDRDGCRGENPVMEEGFVDERPTTSPRFPPRRSPRLPSAWTSPSHGSWPRQGREGRRPRGRRDLSVL